MRTTMPVSNTTSTVGSGITRTAANDGLGPLHLPVAGLILAGEFATLGEEGRLGDSTGGTECTDGLAGRLPRGDRVSPELLGVGVTATGLRHLCTWWIRQGITRALADHARTVRVPCHQVGTLAAIERVRGELSVQHGREPTVEEIAAVLGVTAEETRSLRVVARHPISLHEPLGEMASAPWRISSTTGGHQPGQAVDQHLLPSASPRCCVR